MRPELSAPGRAEEEDQPNESPQEGRASAAQATKRYGKISPPIEAQSGCSGPISTNRFEPAKTQRWGCRDR